MVIISDSHLYLSVSQTSDAMNSWCNYDLNGYSSGAWPSSDSADWPTVGVDANFIYVSLNLYSNSDRSYSESRVIEFQKNQATSCSTVNNASWYNLYDPGTGFLGTDLGDQHAFTIAPEINQDQSASGSNGYWVDSYSGGGCDVTVWTISGSSVSLAQTAIPKQVGTECYSKPVPAKQSGTGTPPVETADSRLSQVVGLDGLLEFGLTTSYDTGCSSGTNDAIEWMIVNGPTNALINQGGFATPCYYYFMPSMTSLSGGGYAFVYAFSASSTYPGSAIITLDYQGNAQQNYITQSSAGSYSVGVGTAPDCSSCARWGDYLSIEPDPVNSNYAWSASEYTTTANTWATWIDRFTQ
jgi:hypothetical protein